jgi:peptidoglycan/LPS O-acetylase OafA/YrhL
MSARAVTRGPAAAGAAPASTERVGELDAVRGIAALVVVLHHCWQIMLPDQNTFPFVQGTAALTGATRWAAWINLSPAKLLFAGHPAVGVFFVLSGVVLTRQLQAAHRLTYPQFVIRRIFRIWVPFAVVILCAALLSQALGGPLPLLPWLNESWNQPLTWQLLGGHLLMIGAGVYLTLDNPTWSLVHEMRISLVFPLLTRLAQRAFRPVLIASLLLFTLLSITHLTRPLIRIMPGPVGSETVRSLIDSVRYELFFLLGIGLALKRSQVKVWLERSPWPRAIWWALAFALLAVPYLARYLELAYALGATLLLALCMDSPRARQLLRAPVLAWLGKVSYSLYLVHLVALLSLVHLLYGVLPLPVILSLAVVASLAIAAFTHRVLEMPANRLGKHLASALSVPPRPTPSLAANKPDEA